MRLPFGLGRRSSSGDGAPSSSPVASSPAPVQPAAASTRAWASLAPIQRATGDMPLVAAPGAFVEALPGSRALPPIVQPLGHEVSNLANPGLVVARVRPVEQAASGAIPRPVQRRAARGVSRQVESAWSEAAEPEVASAPESARSVPVAASTPVAVSRSTAPAETAGAASAMDDHAEASVEPRAMPVVAPIRSMPTVSRSEVRVPDRPLTSAAAAAMPAIQRAAAQAAASAAAGTSASPLPAPSGGMRRAPASSTAPRPGMPAVSRQAAVEAAHPAPATASSPATGSPPSAPPLAPLPALAAAPVRRGLGEPLTAPPSSARPLGAGAAPVVSRATTDGPMPIAASPILAAMHQVAGDASALTELGLPVPRTAQRSPATAASATPGASSIPSAAPLPHLPVARSAADVSATRPAAAHSAAARSVGSDVGAAALPAIAAAGLPLAGSRSSAAASLANVSAAPVQRTPAAPEIRPIAAANPLRPAVALQRAADDAADEGDDDSSAMPSPWWAPAPTTSATPGLGGSRGIDGPAAVQRSAFAASIPARSPVSTYAAGVRSDATSSGFGPALAGANVQRSSRASAPLRLPLAIPTTDTGRQASVAPTAGSSSGAPSITTPGGSIAGEPTVQASRGPGSQPGGNASFAGSSPTVQREGPTASSTSAPAATSQAPARSERDLDELAKALFSRIRTRLRSDLLQDREAAGFTFDNV